MQYSDVGTEPSTGRDKPSGAYPKPHNLFPGSRHKICPVLGPLNRMFVDHVNWFVQILTHIGEMCDEFLSHSISVRF